MNPATRLLASLLLVASLAGTAAAHGPYAVAKPALSPGPSVLFLTDRNAPPFLEAPLECGDKLAGVFGVCGVQTAHHHHPFAVGTCTVAPAVPSVGVAYTFTCGVDRNNDGLISNAPVCAIEDDTVPHGAGVGLTDHDECTGEAAVTGASVEDHADDWVTGSNVAPAQAFCFQDNVRGFTDHFVDDTGAAGMDISLLNQHTSPAEHGDGWSEIVVFVQPVGPAGYLGVTAATVTVVGAAGCGGGLVSAHLTAGNADTDGNGRDTRECSDTVDDDADSLVDDLDPECLSAFGGGYNPEDDNEAPTDCDNGADSAVDADLLADEADPQCHTDGLAANPFSYDPDDPSEV